MVKGVSRHVVVVKPQKTELFEEAIFILKEEAVRRVDAEEVLKEACAVANDYVAQNCERKKWQLPPPVFAVFGALFTGVLWLVFTVI